MSTATAARRKHRLKSDDFPLPFSQLPPDLQERAIESFRNGGHCWEWEDSDFLQENLGEVLEDEFGIEPDYETYKGKDGKTRKGNPEIYWDQYNHVEFEVGNFDIDEVLKHARNDEETRKEHGECYFKAEAQELAVLLHAVEMLEFGMDVDFRASYSLKEGRYSYSRVDWQWDDERQYEGTPEYDSVHGLFDRIDEALKDYYETACYRLRKVIENEQDDHFSDEYIRETLENNEHWTFDEDGDLV